MGRKLSSGEHLFKAVLKNPKMGPIAEFPKQVQDSFRAKLEGSRLPENPSQRRAFKKHFSKFAGRLLESKLKRTLQAISGGAFDLLIQSTYESMEHVFARAKILSNICMHSSNPAKYAAMLSRDEISPDSFLFNASFFNSRKVEFSEIPESNIELREILLSLRKTPSEDSIRKALKMLRELGGYPPNMEEAAFDSMYSTLSAFLGSGERVLEAACAVWPEKAEMFRDVVEYDEDFDEDGGECSTLASAAPELRRFGLQHMYGAEGFPEFLRFRKGFSSSVSGIIAEEPEILHKLNVQGVAMERFLIVDSDSEATIQHELQHLFDHLLGIFTGAVERERRAYLGELAFTPNHEPICEIFMPRSWVGANMHQLVGGPHALAKDMIFKAFKERKVKARSPIEKINAAALEMLNSTYKKLVGLTYTEILEPFSKIDLSPLEAEIEAGFE